MARLTSESWLACHARSADVCGLREFYIIFSPVISELCHFHPRRTPPENSKPEGNTRFAPGTLLLLHLLACWHVYPTLSTYLALCSKGVSQRNSLMPVPQLLHVPMPIWPPTWPR